MEPLLPLIPPFAKWIMTAILSVISIILFVVVKSYARKQAMIAMILSSLGDIFMTDIFGIGDASAVPGAAFFIAAHIVYAICFTNLNKRNGWLVKNKAFYVGIVIMVASALVVTVFAFMVETPQIVMYFLIMIYTAIIGWNLCSNFAYSYNKKRLQLAILPFAITLFYLTDIWIFLAILKIYTPLRDIVWYFYPIAQILLIVFIEPFKKKPELEYKK